MRNLATEQFIYFLSLDFWTSNLTSEGRFLKTGPAAGFTILVIVDRAMLVDEDGGLTLPT